MASEGIRQTAGTAYSVWHHLCVYCLGTFLLFVNVLPCFLSDTVFWETFSVSIYRKRAFFSADGFYRTVLEIRSTNVRFKEHLYNWMIFKPDAQASSSMLHVNKPPGTLQSTYSPEASNKGRTQCAFSGIHSLKVGIKTTCLHAPIEPQAPLSSEPNLFFVHRWIIWPIHPWRLCWERNLVTIDSFPSIKEGHWWTDNTGEIV